MDINYLQDVVRNCTWLTCFDWFQVRTQTSTSSWYC